MIISKYLLLELFKYYRFLSTIKLANYKLEATKVLEQCQWKFITCLHLIRCNVNMNASSIYLKTCRYLKQLMIWGNQIDSEGIASLAKISFNYLKILFLSSNSLGNRGVKQLSKIQFPKLENLSLRDINATFSVFNYFIKNESFTKCSIRITFKDQRNTIFSILRLIPAKNVCVVKLDITYYNRQYMHMININRVAKDPNFSQKISKHIKNKIKYSSDEYKNKNTLDKKYISPVNAR